MKQWEIPEMPFFPDPVELGRKSRFRWISGICQWWDGKQPGKPKVFSCPYLRSRQLMARRQALGAIVAEMNKPATFWKIRAALAALGHGFFTTIPCVRFCAQRLDPTCHRLASPGAVCCFFLNIGLAQLPKPSLWQRKVFDSCKVKLPTCEDQPGPIFIYHDISW